ncbi:helix-turn-helix transcriptional regulator [Saccharospirillum salsuginis]|uniref:AraC family transcriptional regulator n=1 Tax=Saccharospirillum salsuginis TaxID=418750 RepID=A0A918N8H4_9GAMM|nr:AraC family transcriptional regulator [Saccharospirillum salsuginis]GGX48457.1 AraC family transcriptional regulator [Saccharospirillum salsuginis]
MNAFEEHRYADLCATDRHDFHQLLLGLEGCVDIEVEGRGGRIQSGGLCVIPAGAVHHYLGLGAGNRCLTLNLADPMLSPEERRLFDRIRFSQLPAIPSRLSVNDVLNDDLAEMLDLPRIRLNLARLSSRVMARLDERWPVTRLADTANVSERQLRRLLARDTGLTPGQWLTRLRVNVALRELRTTGHTITDIALDCGFQSPAHFSRCVRDRTGLSPRQWRSSMAD